MGQQRAGPALSRQGGKERKACRAEDYETQEYSRGQAGGGEQTEVRFRGVLEAVANFTFSFTGGAAIGGGVSEHAAVCIWKYF